MNFFTQQDSARKKTAFLICGFFLSIVGIILLVDALVYFGVKYLESVQFSDQIYDNLIKHPRYDYINIVLCIIILSGSLGRYYQLKSGGASIVTMLNAIPVDRQNPNPESKQFINIVDEMAIASGIIAPMIYTLPDEPGINAFVAGFHPNDAVLVVTQGALDCLSREEMQGVIAHEFSHIFNSDMALNLRLLIILGGLVGLSQTGNSLLRGKSAASFIIGLILYLCGLIGVFFGNILRAAISRQRETLADACAVQYTRDNNGITRALLKIQAQGRRALMNNQHAEEINHMCFSVARDISPLRLFESHPNLGVRIARLDPTGQIYAQFSQEDQTPSKLQIKRIKPDTQAMFHNITMGAILTSGDKLISYIGNPTARNLGNAENFLHNIPPELMQMLDNRAATQGLIYAIAMTLGRDKKMQKPLLLPAVVQPFFNQAINHPGIINPVYRAALVSLSIPVLKRLQPEEKTTFLQNIRNMIESHVTVSRALLLTILNQHLNEKSFERSMVRFTQFEQIEKEISCIIWFLAQSARNDPSMHANIFAKGIAQLNFSTTQDYSSYQFAPEDLMVSLSKLREIAPHLKQQLIMACVRCIEHDGKIDIPELELLRAVCTCMDCPIPLLAPTAVANETKLN